MQRAAAVAASVLFVATCVAGIFHTLRAERRLPTISPDYIGYVQDLVRAGRHAEAIEQLRLALELDQSAVALHALDQIARTEKEPAARLAVLRARVAKERSNPELRITTARALLRDAEAGRASDPSQNVEEARYHAQLALRFAPDSAAAHEVLGTASLYLGDRPRAIRELREALRLAPQRSSARALLERLEQGADR